MRTKLLVADAQSEDARPEVLPPEAQRSPDCQPPIAAAQANAPEVEPKQGQCLTPSLSLSSEPRQLACKSPHLLAGRGRQPAEVSSSEHKYQHLHRIGQHLHRPRR